MLQFVLSIPNWVGWTLVGVLCGACACLLYRIILDVIEMIQWHRKAKIENKNEMENGD